MEWKSSEEDETRKRYVKARKDICRIDDTVKQCYNCHRSGHCTAKGHGLRHLKVQGSAKIGSYCPAALLVTIKPSGDSEFGIFLTLESGLWSYRDSFYRIR